MTPFYFKRLCPFCDTDEYFFKAANLRRHINLLHGHILPNKSSREYMKGKIEINTDNLHVYPNVEYKLPCPCCSHYAENKKSLVEHLSEHHNQFQATTKEIDDTNGWKLGNLNVSANLRLFRQHCLGQFDKYQDICKYFNHLLAMSSILVVQKRNEYEHVPDEYFSPACLKSIYKSLETDLSLRQSFNKDTKLSIADFLKDYRDKSASLSATRIGLITLSENCHGLEKNVILAIEALLPAIKDLDTDHLSESELTSSFIHPFVQGLFAMDHDDRIARCANTSVCDNDEARRPDYMVDIYRGYTREYSSCIGEIKNQRCTMASRIKDFYRLAVFAGHIINEGTTSVLTFQAIGPKVTFYYMVPNNDILIYVEVAAIRLPTTAESLTEISSYIDDIYSVAVLHNSIGMSTEQRKPFSILPFSYVECKSGVIGKRPQSSVEPSC
ncbi:unnamed protein product [Absidia cylindrospora]